MRAYLRRLGRQLGALDAFELQRFVQPRFVELDAGVGVDDGGVLDVVVQAGPGAHVGLHLQFDAGAVGALPGRRLVDAYLRFVRVRVHDELEVLGLGLSLRSGGDLRGLAGGQLRVQDGRGDADALLAAGLFAGVEPGAIEELPEDLGELFLGDAGPVVLDDEAVVVAGLLDLDVDVGEDAGLLAGVERVVDGLLDGRDQRPGLGVEPEHVLVLLEELGDGDGPLCLGQLLGDSLAFTELRLKRGH